MVRDAPVVIVGAGPVGLATAMGLSRHGVCSVILEKRVAPSSHSGSVSLLPRTLEIFSQWGVLSGMRKAGQWLESWTLWGDNQQACLTLPLAKILGAQTSQGGILILPQSQTEAHLAAAVHEAGYAQVRRGETVVGLQQGKRGVRVDVVRADGQPYSLRTRYLVGCDGHQSTVRSLLQLGWAGPSYPGRFGIADVRIDAAHDLVPSPRLAAVAGHACLAIRLGPRLWRIKVHLAQPHTDLNAAVVQAVEALLGAGPVDVVWGQAFFLQRRAASAFVQGRVILAGDAAHAHSPMCGPGLNAGVADAHNLGWKLAHALRHDGRGAQLLASYDAERTAAARQMSQGQPDPQVRFLGAGPLGRRLLLAAARCLLAWPAWAQARLSRLALLDIHYAHSPLLQGHDGCVGRRLPDAALADHQGVVRPWTQRQGGTAALLIFETASAGRTAALARAAAGAMLGVRAWRIVHDKSADAASPPGATQRTVGVQDGAAVTDTWTLYDVGGVLWSACEAHAGMMALVRPDGYIGWIGHQPFTSVRSICAAVREALGLQALARRPRRHFKALHAGRRSAPARHPDAPSVKKV